MRDTLLLVLAAIGGSVLISVACAGMWIAGNACVEWHDRMLTKREENVRAERAAERWGAYVVIAKRWRSDTSVRAEGWARYSSVDELIAESVRRAGARGESDG